MRKLALSSKRKIAFQKLFKSIFRDLGLVLLVLFCLLSSFCCFSQPYWNEWINFSQKYYKFPIMKNGMYRLDSLTLLSAGIPLSSIDPRNIQLFFRGQEQYIYIEGESDGTFNTSDYIEFYGQKNDGSLDSILYKGDLYNQPVSQPNPYYSLFNDTSTYFITWNNSTVNKRILLSPDTSFSTFSLSANYFMKEDIIENHTNYYTGRSTSAGISFPEYHEGEGWSGSAFGYGGSMPTLYTAIFNTSNAYSSGQNVEVKLAIIGASDDAKSNADHDLQITYKNNTGSYSPIDHVVFDGYRLFDSSYTFSASTLGSSTDIVVSALSGNYTSRNSVPYVVMKFPHNLNLENKDYYEMYVPENTSQSKSFYTFTNFNGSTNSYIYDLTNHIKIPMTLSGNDYKVLIPNAVSSAEKFCIAKSDNQFLPVTSVNPVQGTGFFTNYSTLGSDSAFIIITHKSLRGVPGADEYAAYRANAFPGGGGGHHVLVTEVSELYDQFGYGIPKHPFSIRHFAEYCLDTFPTPPQNLFIIGKSVQTNLGRNQYVDPTGEYYSNSLVPSIGYPTCDNMLVAVLNENLIAPAMPIGRLAAKNISDITTYLRKVKEHEHPNPNPDEWMKHIIHMGGGGNKHQQDQFSTYLHGYETTIENVCFGGFVHHFSKNSSSPTQISYTDSIRALINKGVSLITFFGHSSSTIFEFNILPPEEYDNKDGKYPFFSAAGCTAGDIHQPAATGISSSEQYVFSPKGVIGFLASSGPGTAFQSNVYLSQFYKNIGNTLYGKSVGKCIQTAIDSIEKDGNDIYMNATCLEMTLHADPAIVIHASKLPDYAINNSSVFFNPSFVSAEMDSFDMNIIITNIGSACKNDSVQVEIKRTFINGTSIIYFDTLPPVYFKDTLTMRLPVDPIRGPGLNKFEVKVDFSNDVLELEDVLNNNIEVPLLIYSGDIIPVYPYKYAVVPNDTIILKAYTANPFASAGRYVFEIDTTDLFNSLQKRTQYVTQSGAIVKAFYDGWLNSPLILTDSTVYFWHVRRDTSDTVNFRWRESSFQYIPNKRGWGQSHFFQFLKGDKFSYIDTNRIPRYFDLDFQNLPLQIYSKNFSEVPKCSEFYIDGNKTLSCSYMTALNIPGPHVIIIIMDPVTGYLWYNPGGMYGSFNKPYSWFEFPTGTSAQQEIVRQFLQNIVPCGSKVVLFTDNNHNLGDILGGNEPGINLGLVQAFQSIGSTQFSNIQNNHPYALIGRKCGNAVEKIADSVKEEVFVGDTILIKRTSGYIYSEIIGPASKWKSMHWRYRSPEDNIDPILASKDTIKVTITGIKNDGTSDILINNISKDFLGFDIYDLDSTIDASDYPFLQLQAWVKDSIMRTPAQLKRWQVLYEGVPEAALNPIKHYSFYSPSVQQGDSIKMSVAIENIGDYDMDSLWVDFWVYNSNREVQKKKSVKLDSLLIDSILIGDVKLSTLDIPNGINSLWVEANPFNTEHQLELYHYNNIGAIPFLVKADVINPLLDVTFDGIHIMNGDIVSAKPSIIIKLKDESTFLALNDPSDFDIRLKRPGKTTYDTVSFGSAMTFESAVLPNNSCKINLTPLLADGTYELKVQAKDRSGNASGEVEYKISFEVINKPAVTNILNYPNPFSTSTRFVFTLTGSEVPDYFKIQILTVTGKIVRDLNKYELGPLHIGRNITEYAWDGKDEFGDQLANGLYLYRVMTQLNGTSLEHRESGADSFFTQGYGKMYLIR